VGNRKTIQKRLERARYGFYGLGREQVEKQAEKSLAKAAEYFQLDPKNPTGRERLLYKLADVVFGPDGKKGRPKNTKTYWDSRRLCDLGAIYRKKRSENPKLSKAKIAKLIKDEHKEFKNDDAEQIRQRLRAADREFSLWHDDHDADRPDDWEEPGEPDYDDD
jgi:hypothetical protein